MMKEMLSDVDQTLFTNQARGNNNVRNVKWLNVLLQKRIKSK